jgi:hypothetical protein
MNNAPNFRCSRSCFECDNNKNRLNKYDTDLIDCKLHTISSVYYPWDWVCDDYLGQTKKTDEICAGRE